MNKYTTSSVNTQDLAARKNDMAKWAKHNEQLLAKKAKSEPQKAQDIMRMCGEHCHIEGAVVYQKPSTNDADPITTVLADGTEVKYEYRYIGSDELEVDKSYQLPVNGRRVRMIVDAFDPRLLDAIKVSYRSGRYYIIDGQHRTAACTTMNNGNPVQMYAKIYFDLTKEQEAYLFAKQTGVTRKPGFVPTLNALLLSEDTESLDFVAVTESAGFSLALDGEALGEWRIGAVRKAYEYYRKLGRDAYFDMLLVLANWQNGSIDSLRKEIIGGLGMFFKTYAGKFEQKRLLARLIGKDVFFVTQRTNGFTRNVDKRYAQAFADVYNHGLTQKNRLDMWALQQ